MPYARLFFGMAIKLMIVDDIKFVRDTIAAIAKRAHIQVVAEASNGLEACELYAKTRPDIVTMDLVMPELSGIEATRAICKRDRNARILMVTAMNQESLIMDAINAGAKDYLLKPFTADELLRTLEHLVRGLDAGGMAQAR